MDRKKCWPLDIIEKGGTVSQRNVMGKSRLSVEKFGVGAVDVWGSGSSRSGSLTVMEEGKGTHKQSTPEEGGTNLKLKMTERRERKPLGIESKTVRKIRKRE